MSRKFLQNKGRNERPQVWSISKKENNVTVTWGQLDGAMQTTTQEFEGVNIRKSNEKLPSQVAQEAMDRWINKKEKEGYREVNPKTNEWIVSECSSKIDFKSLPKNLRFFKPLNSINTYLMKKIEDRSAVFLRKRDGMMHVVSIDDKGVPRMFSSNMLENYKNEPKIPWMDRYPHILEEVTALNFPPRTILLGELCTLASEGYEDKICGYAKDDFNYVGSVVKSLTPRALEIQSTKGKLGLCIWDVAFWNSQCWLTEKIAADRFRNISDYLIDHKAKFLTFPESVHLHYDGFTVISQETDVAGDYVYENRDATMLDDKIKTILNWAKNLGWEGFVVIDPDIKYEDKAYNFHGKAERPKECAKLKPTLEADFIVYWDPANGIGEWGKGKKSSGVGSVMAYLWDPDAKEEVPVCKIGGGLTDELVHKFADPKLYPMVWAVEFNEWTAKGALRFPEFVRVRDDKTPEECDIYQRPVKEEEEE